MALHKRITETFNAMKGKFMETREEHREQAQRRKKRVLNGRLGRFLRKKKEGE